MKVLIADFLENQPNYVIAALLLTDDDEFDPVIDAFGESGALSEIREMKARLQLIKTYGAHEFPLGVHNGHILKSPSHIAAAILSGADHFFAQERTIPTEVNIYGKEWLSKLKKENQELILFRNNKILTDLRPIV